MCESNLSEHSIFRKKINPKSLENLKSKHERKWLSVSTTTTIRVPKELKDVILKTIYKIDKVLHENPELLKKIKLEEEDLGVIPIAETSNVLDTIVSSISTKKTKIMLINELRAYIEKYISKPETKDA
jgi:hypothetical protein